MFNGVNQSSIHRECMCHTNHKNKWWHCIMAPTFSAYINFSALKSVLNLQVKPDTKCIVCTMGKHSRSPFNESGTRASKPLEMIRTDVCRPMPIQSLGGSKYLISSIDTTAEKFIFMFWNRRLKFLINLLRIKNS